MAVTIRYRGKLRDVNLIDDLVAEVQDICTANQWLPDAQLRPFGTVFPLLRGVSFRVKENMDSLDLYFNKNGIIFPSLVPFMTEAQHNNINFMSVKTQFWGAQTHIKVVNLLSYFDKKYFETFELQDNGGYYPTQNQDVLNEKFRKGTETIILIKNIIEDPKFQRQFSNPPSPSVLLSHLQKALDKIQKDTDEKIKVTTDDVLDVIDYTQSLKSKKKK